MMRIASGFGCGQRISAGLKASGRVLAMVCLGLAVVGGTAVRGVAQCTSTPVPTTDVGDTYVWDGSTGSNYGLLDTLLIKEGSTGLNRHIYVAINVPAEPNIESAYLCLYGTGYSTSTDSAAISVYTTDNGNTTTWSETGTNDLTWTDQPLLSPNGPVVGPIDTETVGSVTTAKYWYWNVTSAVQAFLQAYPTGGTMGFEFIAAAPGTVSYATFNSREMASDHPRMFVTVTAPSAPTNMNVANVAGGSAQTENELAVSWKSGSIPGEYYEVWRSQTENFTPGDSTSTAVSPNQTGTTYTDGVTTPLTAGTRYYYQVQAISDGGTATSNEVHGTTYTSLPSAALIVLDPIYAPGSPVYLAAQDLQNDLNAVFGTTTTFNSDYPYTSEGAIPTGQQSQAIIVITGGLANTQSTTTAYGTSPYDSKLTGAETHSVTTVDGKLLTGGPQRIVLQGADTRGTMYAIYEFSDQILGVPPLYHWSGWTAPTTALTEIAVQSNLAETFSPAVPYRGAFANDTDLLEPWIVNTLGKIDWTNPSAGYTAFFETLLRLKLNLFDVGAISDMPPAGTQTHPNTTITLNSGMNYAYTCQQRGLMVTFTHTSPFGASFGDWNNYWSYENGGYPPTPLVVASINDQTDLDTFWKHYLNLAVTAGFETMQTLAFRGDGDEPWYDYVQGDHVPANVQFEASTMASELTDQLGDLTAVAGANPLVRTVFYDEVSTYMQNQLTAGSGFTFAPPNVTNDSKLIWSFANTQRDHFPNTDIQLYQANVGSIYNTQKIGYYENLEYSSTGSHLTSNEGPAKLEANQRFVMGQTPAGNYWLTMLNVGNFREFTLETAAGANLLWNGTSSSNPNEYTTASFMGNFSQRYFVDAAAPGPAYGPACPVPPATATLCTNIAGVYNSYYGHQWNQNPNSFEGSSTAMPNQYVFQDLRYWHALMRLIADIENYCYDPTINNTDKQYCTNVGTQYVTQPFNGRNPFTDPPGDVDEYEVYAPSGSYQMDEMTSATGTAATNFASDLSNCKTQKVLVAAWQKIFLEDTLCSHAEMLEYLNEALQDLGYANQHVLDSSYGSATTAGTFYYYVANAQTAMTSFATAYGYRSTAAFFTGADGDQWYAPVDAGGAKFDLLAVTTGLTTLSSQAPKP